MPGAKPPPLRKRRRIPWPAVFITLAVAALVSPIIFFSIWRTGISGDIRRFETKARAAGEPITLQELAATRKPVPDDENVAVALMDIWQEEDPAFWKAFRARQRKLPDRVDPKFDPNLPVLGANHKRNTYRLPWSDLETAAARAFVATNQERSARIRAALKRPRAQYQINLLDGILMPTPHDIMIKREASRLLLGALLATTDQQVDAAVDQIEQIVALGNTLTDEPCLFSQLVRSACFNIAFLGTEELFKNTTPDKQQFDRLAELFGQLKLKKGFYVAMLDERAADVAVFDKPVDKLDAPSSDSAPDEEILDKGRQPLTMKNSTLNAIGVFSLDQRLMLKTFDRVLDLSRDGNWDDLLKCGPVIQDALADADKFPPKLVSGLLISSLENSAEKFVKTEALRRCALLAIKVVRFREAHGGRLPESLDPIVAKNPNLPAIDPFDGKQLRYRVLQNGFVVYSVGPDRIDQKGVSKAPKNNSSAYDVAFTVGTNGSE